MSFKNAIDSLRDISLASSECTFRGFVSGFAPYPSEVTFLQKALSMTILPVFVSITTAAAGHYIITLSVIYRNRFRLRLKNIP